MSKYLVILFLFFMPFFFLGLSCVTFFFFSFHAFLFFLLGLRCSSFFGAGHFPLSFWGAPNLFFMFLVSFPCFLFSGALCFLFLSLDRLNKPLRNRFLLVLSRFSDRLRGTMVPNQKPYHERYAQVLAPNMSMLCSHIHEYGHV